MLINPLWKRPGFTLANVRFYCVKCSALLKQKITKGEEF